MSVFSPSFPSELIELKLAEYHVSGSVGYSSVTNAGGSCIGSSLPSHLTRQSNVSIPYSSTF